MIKCTKLVLSGGGVAVSGGFTFHAGVLECRGGVIVFAYGSQAKSSVVCKVSFARRLCEVQCRNVMGPPDCQEDISSSGRSWQQRRWCGSVAHVARDTHDRGKKCCGHICSLVLNLGPMVMRQYYPLLRKHVFRRLTGA